MLKTMNRLIVTSLMAVAPWIALADEVYKYVDEKGVVHYTDTPVKGAERADLPQLQSYSGSESRGDAASSEQSAPSSIVEKRSPPASVQLYSDLAIASPKADETFHTANAQVTASIATRAGLLHELGHRVVFYVDGQVQPAAEGQSSLALQGLGRGTHTLSAAIVDGQGQVLAQSANINFHLLPPTVLKPAPRRPGAR
jgi:hypothetical protein